MTVPFHRGKFRNQLLCAFDVTFRPLAVGHLVPGNGAAHFVKLVACGNGDSKLLLGVRPAFHNGVDRAEVAARSRVARLQLYPAAVRRDVALHYRLALRRRAEV